MKKDLGGHHFTAEAYTRRPARIIGTIQHGGESIPDECPHCHNPWLLILPDEAQCLCGLIYFLTVGERA